MRFLLRTMLVPASVMGCCAGMVTTSPTSAKDTFYGLGNLGAGAHFKSSAINISGDGSTVIGFSDNPSGHREAFRWTMKEGIQGLGFIDGGGFQPFSMAKGANADGSIIVGQSTNASSQGEAFRWTAAGGMKGLGFIGGDNNKNPTSRAENISADSTVIVGRSSNTDNQHEAFRWTEDTGMRGLGFIGNGGTKPDSTASAVSGDGSVIVGQSSNSYNQKEAFRWTADTSMQGLNFIDGGGNKPNSIARVVSENGFVIVGHSSNASDQIEAFRWTADTRMQGLGFINGGGSDPFSNARAVNSDGSVIVGQSSNAAGTLEAFRWTENTGMMSIAKLLEAGGVSINTWALSNASGVSANGQVIVGSGINQNGAPEAWIIRFSNPGTPITPVFPDAPPPPPVIGFITPSELSASIADMQQVGVHGFSIAQGSLDDQVFIGQNQCAPNRFWANNANNRVCTFATGTGEFWGSDNIQGRSTVGIAMQVLPGLTIGGNAHAGRSEFDLRLGGKDKIGSYGGGLFASYASGQTGLRLLGAITASNLEYDITRQYTNGSNAIVTSKGSSNGSSIGGLARVGWMFNLLDSATITPFTDLAWTQATLDGYTEHGGPFPFSYRGREGHEVGLRLGVEGHYAVTTTLELTASAAWTHSLSGLTTGVTGDIIDLSSFALNSVNLPDDWAELSVGVNYNLTETTRISGQVVTAIGSTDQPDTTVRAGISMDF